jgi:hypothetical protein
MTYNIRIEVGRLESSGENPRFFQDAPKILPSISKAIRSVDQDTLSLQEVLAQKNIFLGKRCPVGL